MTSNAKKSDKRRIFCNHCQTETNHFCKGEYVFTDDDDAAPTGWWEEIHYRFLICAGCERATLEQSVTCPFPDINESNPTISFHPPRKRFHVEGKRFLRIPKELDRIYQESIEAFNNELYILCTAGLRALIEGICKDKGISGSNLEKKIDGLTAYLPSNIVANIHGFRFMGNVALHELNPPNKHNLKNAIEICEDLLNFLYDLDYKTQRLLDKSKAHKKTDSQGQVNP